MSTASGPARHRRLRDALVALFAVTAIACVAVVGYWVGTGGRWFVVDTPSMGTTAPVGTLLWVEPVDVHDLHVGEFITFRPPGSRTTYSHRVHHIYADGSISTKGEISPVDPWRLHGPDIVGRVVWHWQGVGRLVDAAPLIVLGVLVLTLGVSRLVAAQARLSVRVLGASTLLALWLVLYRPLTGAVQLSAGRAGDGDTVNYVSTGLLPLTVRGVAGQEVHLNAGQVGSVLARRTGQAERATHYAVTLHPHVPWWLWLVLALLCLLPATWTTFAQRRLAAVVVPLVRPRPCACPRPEPCSCVRPRPRPRPAPLTVRPRPYAV